MDDIYDDVRHHPSHSIPNAAYPDSPYRPGTGGPSGPSYPASAVTMSAPEWTHDDIPDGPPPPYAPAQAPAAYSPLDAAAVLAVASHRPAADVEAGRMRPRPEMVPLQLLPSARLPMGGGGGGGGGGPVPPPSSAATVQDGDGDKLDPVLAAQRRKHRRLRMCLVVMTALLIFVGALVIGFAVGLTKASHSSSSSNNSDRTKDYFYHD